MERGRCKSCRAEVIWVTMLSGRAMPLDPDPVGDGSVYRHRDGRWRAVTQGDIHELHLLAPFYNPHFRTCPNAAQHRWRQAQKPIEVLSLGGQPPRILARRR